MAGEPFWVRWFHCVLWKIETSTGPAKGSFAAPPVIASAGVDDQGVRKNADRDRQSTGYTYIGDNSTVLYQRQAAGLTM